MNYSFTHQVAGNKKKLKLALLSMTSFAILCFIGIAVSYAFWDEYTSTAYSFRYQANVTVGWPAFISGWGWWLGVGTLVFLPFLYFMQDLKNPSLGLTYEGLFINQQLMRNIHIPYSGIKSVQKKGTGYVIKFKDNQEILKQVGLFKPFVKYNLENDSFVISDIHSQGDLDSFFDELNKKIG
jgi:hypothetical protein